MGRIRRTNGITMVQTIIPTTEDEANKLSKRQLVLAVFALKRDLNRKEQEFAQRMAAADKNFAIVCNERDVAIAKPTLVNAKIEAERDTYKRMYDELVEKMLKRRGYE